MGLNVSQKERLDTFDQPRHLTQSEIASLRRDAISTSTEMKAILLERQIRQKMVCSATVEEGSKPEGGC